MALHWLGWFWYLMPFSLNRHEGWIMWLDSLRFGLRPVQTVLFAIALGGCLVVIPLRMTRRYQDCPKAAVSWVAGTALTLALLVSAYRIYRSVPYLRDACCATDSCTAQYRLHYGSLASAR